MAQDNNGTNLDLAQILQTLANLPAVPNVSQPIQQESYDQGLVFPNHPTSFSNSGPTLPGPVPYGHDQLLDPRSDAWTPLHHRPPPPKPQARTATPPIDPSTIIEWKHGLRCVNKIASHNSTFVASVQKLMKDQEQNVKAWAAGRDRLYKEHIEKRQNEKKFRAAVSLPGVLEGTPPLRTPEREQEEHDQYTQKVYRASRQMVESHSAALKGLGVPFFGVKPDLVIADDNQSSDLTDEATLNPPADTNGKITKKELLELQRKMLNHLMEMYGD